MKQRITAYIGLRRKDGSEPPEASGYTRASVGEINIWDLPGVLVPITAAFSEVSSPGYGVICDIALFDCRDGGMPMWVFPQQKKLDYHAGVIPFVRELTLYRGMDVSAQIKLETVNKATTKTKEELS